MAKVKKSKKKKWIIAICIVLVVAIVGGTVAYAKIKNKGEEITTSSISTGSITQTVTSTADITSGTVKDYKVTSVATVKQVLVKTGDKVKKGDVLATFDTSTLESEVQSLQSTYNKAYSTYRSLKSSQSEAQTKLNGINKQIATLEKQIKKLQKAVIPTTSKNKKAAIGLSVMAITPYADNTTSNLDDLKSISDALTQLADQLSKLTDDIDTMNAMLKVISDAASEAMKNGMLDPDVIAKKCGDAVADAIQKGLIDETKLLIESGAIKDAVETAVKSVNWEGIAKTVINSNNVTLTSKELQLSALMVQKELYAAKADATVVNSQRQVVDSAKSALDKIQAAQQEMQAGWKADFDGIITQCDLTAGSQTTLMSKGITLENKDKMTATISLGKYDIAKVKVGMSVKITSVNGEYKGKVIFIAPTATGGNETSILDNVGSMAGISGLSSLTASGAGVECKIEIENPDENLIPGFDADVEINTGTESNVVVVPIESIILDKNGSYVYKYDADKKEATKTKITTGATSDTDYEVLSGVAVGDTIVSTPQSDWDDTIDAHIKK